jgi:hypothetical protein
MISPEEIAALAQFATATPTLSSALLPIDCWRDGSFMPGLKSSMKRKGET